MSSFSRVIQASPDVVRFQVGVVGEQFGFGHPVGQRPEDVFDTAYFPSFTFTSYSPLHPPPKLLGAMIR